MKDKTINSILLISGSVIGLINGFLGSGGGVLSVIVLLIVLKHTEKSAHATTLLIMMPISIVSAIVYIINGHGNWLLIVLSSIGVLIGGVIGAFMLKSIKTPIVEIIFAILLIISGIGML
ncbi:MAG: sulfite exporter TauE/SafE family protein [Clostridia bacterium]